MGDNIVKDMVLELTCYWVVHRGRNKEMIDEDIDLAHYPV